jgi:hypothetical protein
MDTCGKDGTIKHVIGYFNPVDVHITNFKQPTEVERRHHFLRRNQRGAPGTGPDRHLQPLALRGRAGGKGRRDLHYPPPTVDVKALKAQLKEQKQD